MSLATECFVPIFQHTKKKKGTSEIERENGHVKQKKSQGPVQ
jgi:hypothetical protein